MQCVCKHTHTHTHTLHTDGIPLITAGDSEESLTPSQPTESTSLDGGGGVMGVVSSSVDPPPVPFNDNPLQPPSWKTHANSDRDILEDVSFLPPSIYMFSFSLNKHHILFGHGVCQNFYQKVHKFLALI